MLGKVGEWKGEGVGRGLDVTRKHQVEFETPLI